MGNVIGSLSKECPPFMGIQDFLGVSGEDGGRHFHKEKQHHSLGTDHCPQLSKFPTWFPPFHKTQALWNFGTPCFPWGPLAIFYFPTRLIQPILPAFPWTLFVLLTQFTFGLKCHFLFFLHLISFMRFCFLFLYFSFFSLMLSPASVANPSEEKHQYRDCPSQGCLPWVHPGEEGLWHRHVKT